MSLLSIQRTMARAVMQPLTRSERMGQVAPNGKRMSQYAAQFIKPNDRLTSFERLEIYNKQYWFRLIAGLTEDFPGLQAILGNRRFEQLCIAYLTDCPSRSFTLRNLGRGLEHWMKKNPRWAGARQGMALDMVRLEWADTEAFDGKQEEPIKTEKLAAASAGGANLRLRLQPYVRLLHFQYPVDSLVLKIKSLNDDTEVASNAFRERHKRKQVQAIAKLEPTQIFLAVHRVDYSVYFRRLELAEFNVLAAIEKGQTLGQALRTALAKCAKNSEPTADEITGWFSNWASLGWFCAPESKK